MRSKTLVVRPRFSVSPRKPPLTTIGLRQIPTPNADDENEEYERYVDCSDDETVCERKRRRLDCRNSGGVDWLDGEACIQCNEGGEELLVCGEIGCSVALHERCLRVKPKIDDAGKFWCPYCWYKREVTKTREMREKIVLGKKAFSYFMDSRTDNVKQDYGRRDDVNGLSTRQSIGRRECTAFSNVEGGMGNQAEGDHDCNGDGGKRDESDQAKVVIECRSEPALAAVDGCDTTLGIEPLENPVSKENANDVLLSKSEEAEFVEDEEQLQEDDDDPDEEITEDEEEELLNTQDMETAPSEEEGIQIPAAPENTMVPARGEVAQKEPGSFDTVVDTITGHRRHNKRSGKRKASSSQASEQRASNQNKKVSPSKKRGYPDKSFKERMYTNYANERRKRVLWSTEEEEMLKIGVEKYSTATSGNIPWRKILEYGDQIFDSTRTPDDLRSKWKNSMAKARG